MNDLIAIIIAISGLGISMIAVVISMMFWCRQEANSLRAEAKEDRKGFSDLYRESERLLSEHRKEMNQISRNIELEMKDFHHRLIEIERSRKAS